MIPMQVALGFSQGIMPLVSYTYASGNRKRMKAAIVFALRIIGRPCWPLRWFTAWAPRP